MRDLPTDVSSLPGWCVSAIANAATEDERQAMLDVLHAERVVGEVALDMKRDTLRRIERLRELGRKVNPQPGEKIGEVLDRLDGDDWLEARALITGTDK